MEINVNGVPRDPIPQMEQKKIKKRSRWGVFVGGFLFGALVVVGALYYKYPQIFSLRTPEEQTKIAVQALVKEVGKIMILPANEEPIVLDITDPQALIAQQQFFAGSVAGDKLLLYKESARAIVYSPSRHLIVNVGPVTNQQAAAAQAQPQAQSSTTLPKKK